MPDRNRRRNERHLECDRCGRSVVLESANFNIVSSDRDSPELCCPVCNDDPRPSHFSSHSIAIRFNGAWTPTMAFLSGAFPDGVAPVTTSRDRVTLRILIGLANLEYAGHFNYGSPENLGAGIDHAKIAWQAGSAVGYSRWSLASVRSGTHPTLRQVFVRTEFRRRGNGGKLILDFFATTGSGPKLVEYPNDASCRLLERLGFVERTSMGWKSCSDQLIGFLPPGE